MNGQEAVAALFSRLDAWAEPRPPLVVFDLDSCLFDTGPRNLAILRAFIAAQGREEELGPLADHLEREGTAWNIVDDLAAAGCGDQETLRALRRFWKERFFTSAWLAHDRPYPGAADFVLACRRAGARLAYVTGRDRPHMEAGTRASLERAGMPSPQGQEVLLLLKPRFEMSDLTFKGRVLGSLRAAGEVVATFENEPANANQFARAFPGALHFLLQTLHSPRADQPGPEIHLLPAWPRR